MLDWEDAEAETDERRRVEASIVWLDRVRSTMTPAPPPAGPAPLPQPVPEEEDAGDGERSAA